MSNNHAAKAFSRRRTQTERTELSSRRLIQAAIDLILERGVRSTTLKDVGERAGYSRGLTNHRFGSKDGLLLGVLLHSRRQWLAQLNREVGDKRGLDAIMAAVDAFKEYLDSAPRHYRATILLWYDSVGQPNIISTRLAAHHRGQLRDVRDWVEQGIADGTIDPATDPDGFATGFCSWVFGTAYQWQLQPDLFDLDRVFDSYRCMMRRALKTVAHSN